MSKHLSSLLRKEQFAFLSRDRSHWDDHLARARAFLGEGLRAADPGRPVLILGAGPGLEVPWALAPALTTGWDADPWSRLWTAARHHRWPPWVFEDLTGGLTDLTATTRRSILEPWSGHRRSRDTAARRLAGLLPSLQPEAAALRGWITAHQPGTILMANVLGQIGVVAERVVEAAFGQPPWDPDPDRADPLAEALEAWTQRAILACLAALRDSGADLWLLHDRAIVFSGGGLSLGPWENNWSRQLSSDRQPLEVSDALARVDVVVQVAGGGLDLLRQERWIWPLAPGQRHLVEALAFRRKP